jgi:ferredoxin
MKHRLLIKSPKGEKVELELNSGQNLREALMENGLSPYTSLTKSLNCGGRGLCATCGVFILNADLRADHWHDRLAKQFHYPRLSCQITVDCDLEIEIPSKLIWGNRRKPL